jgi:hypothetical protein
MSTFLNSLVGRLREIVGNRRRAPRRNARVSARLPFTIALLDPKKLARHLKGKGSLTGHTSDLGEMGMTLVLPSLRIGDDYLTEENNYLLIELEIPGGPVTMLGDSARFAYTAGAGYLLGVRIVKMQEVEHVRYLKYLRTLSPVERRGRKQNQEGVRAHTIPGPNVDQTNTWTGITPTHVSEAFERFLREREDQV